MKRSRVCSDECRIRRNRYQDKKRREQLRKNGLCRQCRAATVPGSDKCEECKKLHVAEQRGYRHRFKGKRMEQSWNKLRRERRKAQKVAAQAALRIACRRIAQARSVGEAANLILEDLVIQYHEV